ncbi:hypothetical protein PVK06_040613 [Gossypium arboreum]|uniref:Uncharacterized protein n=1 Tax=Gossypium arboreum TaxID=29729 RepID=A0ABR0N621_GOSAR|nr:hypothetical protein PVK06_040613 [Gossypium arboreum]
MDIGALLTSAGINIAICVVLLSLYSILRKQPSNPSQYINTLLVPKDGEIPIDIQSLSSQGIFDVVIVNSIHDLKVGTIFDPVSLINALGNVQKEITREQAVQDLKKEVLFLGELEEVLEATQSVEFQRCMVPLFRQIARCLNSLHFQRITIPEILQDEWFKKGYKPPKFEQAEDVNLDDNILYFTWL